MEYSKLDFMETTPHLQKAAEKAAQEMLVSGANTAVLEDCDGMILVRHNTPEFEERDVTPGTLLFPVKISDETFFVSLA